MKVLHFGMSSKHGGVESFILNYGKYLEKSNITFDYVDLYGKGLVHSDQIVENHSIIYTLNDTRKHPFTAAKKIKRIIDDGEYSCVHINMLSAANPVAVFVSLKSNARVIVHSHNSNTVGIIRKVMHAINSLLLKCLPIIRVACSNNAGTWMFGNKSFEVIPNSVDVDQFKFDIESRTCVRKSLGINDNTIVLGFVGRLFEQKNPKYLIKILYATKKILSADVKLLIVGDGKLLEEVSFEATRLDVAKDVVFVGKQDNTAGWYSAMDVFLLPSLWEGFPLVCVEAQTAGLPCLFSDCITDEVVLTDLVHFCELTDNAENWGETIKNILKMRIDRSKYCDDIGQSKYSIKNSAEMLCKLYED